MAPGIAALLARQNPPVERRDILYVRDDKIRIQLYWMADVIPRFRAAFSIVFIAQILSEDQNAAFQYPPHLSETLLCILHMIQHIDAYAQIHAFVRQR